ncbi:MAG: phosphate ABC transporter ATP-binding protein, partial [Acidimicrobiales bacterium]
MKFGSTAVLSDVNVEFRRGSITALIGPTGSGKSTFLRTLNRMNDRVPGFNHRGDVTLDGQSIFGSDIDLLDLRRRVGMVFQRPNPFPMSIAENVIAGVRAHRMARRHELGGITERYLTEVGLLAAVSGRLNKSPFQLSGGQQQLLCLARALAVEPEVLLLDEPTSSLDPVTTEEVEELLCRLAPDHTLVIVTHNLAQARRIADHVVFFHQGRMVEY